MSKTAPSGTHALGVATARATVDEISAEGTTLPVQGFSMEIAGNFDPMSRLQSVGNRQRDLFLGVNPLFDDHLTHASAHTESLWLARWAREG